jgi:hypothetical protein
LLYPQQRGRFVNAIALPFQEFDAEVQAIKHCTYTSIVLIIKINKNR